MQQPWNIEKIKEILPQRYPFLFVDKVLDFDSKEKKITCLKNVTINDYFFKGHFPHQAIMPGVLMVEALAQASILLLAAIKPEIAAKNPDYFLGKTETKFLSPVRPGDKLILEVQADKIIKNMGITQTVAKVGDTVKVKGKLMFGIKFNSSSK
jgi:3-hydroxyacyl-[acyl-carrier-protein] dehydratase